MQNLFLVRVIGDVEPQVLGPYKSAKQRDKMAVEIKRDIVDAGNLDGLFMLDTSEGYTPKMSAYSNGFFMEAGISH